MANSIFIWPGAQSTSGGTTIFPGPVAMDSLILDSTNQDTILARDAAAIFAQRNTTVAQAFRVYNTFTSLSVGEYAGIDWKTSANSAIIGTRTFATGTARAAVFASQNLNASDSYSGMWTRRDASGPIHVGFFTAGLAAISTGFTGNLISLAGLTTFTTTSGSVNPVVIAPTYNQASGTAANTDLLINRTETAVGSGAQLLANMQVGGSNRFSVDTAGGVTSARANTQSLALLSLTELTTIAAAATTDTTIQMPAGAIVLAVNVRVTVVIPTATNFTVGDSGSAARFNNATVSAAANSTDAGTKAGAYYNASALSVRITPDMTPAANTGRVRVTIYYFLSTPPAS